MLMKILTLPLRVLRKAAGAVKDLSCVPMPFGVVFECPKFKLVILKKQRH